MKHKYDLPPNTTPKKKRMQMILGDRIKPEAKAGLLALREQLARSRA